MSNGTPQPVNASSDPYSRGFQAGCLVGCAPLVLILVGIVFLSSINSGSSTFSSAEPPAALLLPEITATATEETLLPAAPPANLQPVYLGNDLSKVPLVALESGEYAPTEEWKKRKAHAVAAALYLNQKESDGYLKAVLRNRRDLSGLPFAMGNACRTTGDAALAFKEAAEAVRNSDGAALVNEPDPNKEAKLDRETCYKARMAVAGQVIPAATATKQQSLIRGLASIPRPEATVRLARLAVYSPEEALRNAALEALAVRRGEDAADVLAAGLRYPWPAVAENAATTIVRLKQAALIPQLEAMLDAPDPRAPRLETVDGREETVAYELVRVNHLHNCLLCHAPLDRGAATKPLSAEIPVPTVPLPDTSRGYGETDSNLLVRIDVTYLRQDFSAPLEVTDWSAQSWTARQRFDFLLRRRLLSPAEASELRKRLAGVSPYQRAAARALRALTGLEVALNPVN